MKDATKNHNQRQLGTQFSVKDIVNAITFEENNYTPQEQYKANLLGVIIVGNIIGLFIFIFYAAVSDITHKGVGFFVMCVTLLINLLCLRQVIHGKTSSPSRVIIGSGWIVISLASLGAGGLYSSAMMGFVALFIMGLLLLDARARLILYGGSVLYFFFLWGVEVSGNLPDAPFKDLPFRVMMLIATFTSLFLVLWYHLYAIYKSQERIKTLEVEAKQRELQRSLAQDLAHDLRTPVSVLKTSAYLIRRRQEKGLPTDEVLQRLENRVDDLSLMIEDLFQLTLLDTNLPRQNIELVEINHIITTSVDDCREYAHNSNIDILFTPIIDQKIIVRGDRKQLKRMFDNLIKNAIQYGVDGGYVSISMQLDSKNVTVDIEDNGVGISPNDQAQIFERFYRVDKARTHREKQGTGIGLSTVKRLVGLHSGTITVKSELGTGSTFTITLPASSA